MSQTQALIKRDTYENWEKCFGKYIPSTNVLIIMDKSNGEIIIKLGDGKTLIDKLPNIISNPFDSASVEGQTLRL